MTAPRYYKVRLGKDRPLCGLKIWRGFGTDPVTGETIERAWIWRAAINGVEEPIDEIAPWFADGTGDTMRGSESDAAEYLFFCKASDHDKKHDPESTYANPRKEIDHLKGDLIF